MLTDDDLAVMRARAERGGAVHGLGEWMVPRDRAADWTVRGSTAALESLFALPADVRLLLAEVERLRAVLRQTLTLAEVALAAMGKAP